MCVCICVHVCVYTRYPRLTAVTTISQFLSLDNINIWGQVILCGGGPLVHCRSSAVSQASTLSMPVAPLSGNHQKRLQTFPYVPWETRCGIWRVTALDGRYAGWCFPLFLMYLFIFLVIFSKMNMKYFSHVKNSVFLNVPLPVLSKKHTRSDEKIFVFIVSKLTLLWF